VTAALAATREWLEKAVIGLNLCPFAKAVHLKDQIRWVESEATEAEALLADLVHELRVLAAADADAIETTVLVHPRALTDFDDYNDFLDVVDAALEELGLDGELQVASFHPQYRFDGTDDDDVTNFTNRSPFPTLHLLRESSIERALASFPDAAAIFERNQATLRGLGPAGWRALFAT
jgi:uncharacterized protein